MTNQSLSADSQALLLLCSTLAIPPQQSEGLKPLTPGQWRAIEQKLGASSLGAPAALFETGPADWESALALTSEEAERIERLLSRGGQLGIELERLEGLGVWVTTPAEPAYPARLRDALASRAPVVLFGAGEPSILDAEGVAVVGSRDIDPEGARFAERLGQRCAAEGLTVISGGARGTDQLALSAAFEQGGRAVSILAHGIEASIRNREERQALLSGNVVLLAPFPPRSGFKVHYAMERNKYIYALSRYAVVVASSEKTGGTWSGAIENLKRGWAPLFVRACADAPPGNSALVDKGGIAMPTDVLLDPDLSLAEWLSVQEHPHVRPEHASDGQMTLFD